MNLVVDELHVGPHESQWTPVIERMAPPPLDLAAVRRLVVLAPHPDDEVAGAGGLIRWALLHSVPIEVIAVTDGEGSHPHSRAVSPSELADLRSRESLEALRRLGWERPSRTCLHLPDGGVSSHVDQLDEVLSPLLGPGVCCVAPWRFDGHPDHDALGAAALELGGRRGSLVWSYLVWGWHWTDPAGQDIPWARARRLELSRRDRARKRWAMGAFTSQISPIGPAPEDRAVLPPRLLPRFWRSSEIYLDEGRVSP